MCCIEKIKKRDALTLSSILFHILCHFYVTFRNCDCLSKSSNSQTYRPHFDLSDEIETPPKYLSVVHVCYSRNLFLLHLFLFCNKYFTIFTVFKRTRVLLLIHFIHFECLAGTFQDYWLVSRSQKKNSYPNCNIVFNCFLLSCSNQILLMFFSSSNTSFLEVNW